MSQSRRRPPRPAAVARRRDRRPKPPKRDGARRVGSRHSQLSCWSPARVLDGRAQRLEAPRAVRSAAAGVDHGAVCRKRARLAPDAQANRSSRSAGARNPRSSRTSRALASAPGSPRQGSRAVARRPSHVTKPVVIASVEPDKPQMPQARPAAGRSASSTERPGGSCASARSAPAHQAKRGWWAITKVNPALKRLPALVVPVQSLRNGRGLLPASDGHDLAGAFDGALPADADDRAKLRRRRHRRALGGVRRMSDDRTYDEPLPWLAAGR